jgi:hypothetical protein
MYASKEFSLIFERSLPQMAMRRGIASVVKQPAREEVGHLGEMVGEEELVALAVVFGGEGFWAASCGEDGVAYAEQGAVDLVRLACRAANADLNKVVCQQVCHWDWICLLALFQGRFSGLTEKLPNFQRNWYAWVGSCCFNTARRGSEIIFQRLEVGCLPYKIFPGQRYTTCRATEPHATPSLEIFVAINAIFLKGCGVSGTSTCNVVLVGKIYSSSLEFHRKSCVMSGQRL